MLRRAAIVVRPVRAPLLWPTGQRRRRARRNSPLPRHIGRTGASKTAHRQTHSNWPKVSGMGGAKRLAKLGQSARNGKTPRPNRTGRKMARSHRFLTELHYPWCEQADGNQSAFIKESPLVKNVHITVPCQSICEHSFMSNIHYCPSGLGVDRPVPWNATPVALYGTEH